MGNELNNNETFEGSTKQNQTTTQFNTENTNSSSHRSGAMEDDWKKRGREMESTVLERASDVIASINGAGHVDQVIISLHSIAVLLFPVDSIALSGSIDKQNRDQVLSAKVHSENERGEWRRVFYQGAAFPTLARILLFDVASNWLACFPFSARKHVYDVFFVSGHTIEVVQTLVPPLQQTNSGNFDTRTVRSNAERLLALCLLENKGVLQIAREFGISFQTEDISTSHRNSTISRVAQLVTSVPDKAHGNSKALSAHQFFRQITDQLIAGAEEWDHSLPYGDAFCFTILYVGESFARICRRGFADVLLNQVTPQILRHVRNALLTSTDEGVSKVLETKSGCHFWLKLVEAIKDQYAVERFCEQLLFSLVAEHVSDVEAYWILWTLFSQTYETQSTIRSMLLEKFLLWKVFPVCCLKWILQFAVLEYSPDVALPIKGRSSGLIAVSERLAVAWSKKEFVQSIPMEQQTYVTAALGLSLEKMSKEDLDAAKDLMPSILQGVSVRLESPADLVRRMAGSIALVFSKIIDPNNPLYLDDSFREDDIDWEFGLTSPGKGTMVSSQSTNKDMKVETSDALLDEKNGNDCIFNSGVIKKEKASMKKKSPEFKLIDPDEIIDPVTLNSGSLSGDEEEIDDDDASEDSETSSESSLQPYDLSDDDTDLKKSFSQLVDVVGALRKSDNVDGVERALDVAEKLVRASPDELSYIAGDLVKTLVQVRCSDTAEEGEEESAEEKRQKALVALAVTSPFESLDSLNKLLYSPHVDISQRVMILDVMTDAALELANAKVMRPKHRNLISDASKTQQWFMPRSIGPSGAGPWKEIASTDTPLNWSYSYERELPSRSGQIKKGKTRRWNLHSENTKTHDMDLTQNKFPQYAAAFMLPAMQGFDKKRHGVDLLGRDFIVLGKLIHMLGVCMKCAAMHPEASALALPFMDMLSSREVCHHAEAYVRRSVLFAATCILVALHPSFVASSLMEGNSDISKGLEWVRSWALHVAESDTDRDCYSLAVTCLQLHSEMALQTSRALESMGTAFTAKTIDMPSSLLKGVIKIPH